MIRKEGDFMRKSKRLRFYRNKLNDYLKLRDSGQRTGSRCLLLALLEKAYSDGLADAFEKCKNMLERAGV